MKSSIISDANDSVPIQIANKLSFFKENKVPFKRNPRLVFAQETVGSARPRIAPCSEESKQFADVTQQLLCVDQTKPFERIYSSKPPTVPRKLRDIPIPSPLHSKRPHVST
jgi:hypothetical protein